MNMKKRMILTIGLLMFFASGDLVFGEEQWYLEINNNTERYWLINIDKICVGAVEAFGRRQIKIERPTKKFQVEIVGISSDRGHSQKRSFWPEDHKDHKFIWQVEP
jgi:hypothetical protein